MAPEMSVSSYFNQLTRLVAREDFIIQCRREGSLHSPLFIPVQFISRSHPKPPDFSIGPWHFELQKQLYKLKFV
jgi:hypothetical protein